MPRIVLVLLGLAVCVVAVPAGLAGRWFVTETVEAGKGAASPAVAALAYFLDTPLGGEPPEAGPAYNLYCADDERLHEQAVQLANAARRANVQGMRAFERVDLFPGHDETKVDGDRATHSTMATWVYTNTDPNRKPGSAFWYESAAQRWEFELVNDNGWRVCKVTAPDPVRAGFGAAL